MRLLELSGIGLAVASLCSHAPAAVVREEAARVAARWRAAAAAALGRASQVLDESYGSGGGDSGLGELDFAGDGVGDGVSIMAGGA